VVKFARRFAVFLLIAVGILLVLPAEKARATGQWMLRDGLRPQTVRIGRFEVRYVRKGEGSSVILIHGLASSVYTWAGVIGPLAQGFDVVALDLPGFGASSQPDDLAFSDYLPTMIGFMDALGIEKASLVGNSMGGAVALQTAARAPDRLDKVVLLDSAGFSLKEGERPFPVKLLASRAMGWMAERLPIRRLLTRATLRYLLHDRERLTDERIDEYVAPFLRSGAVASARSLLRSRIDEGFVADLGGIDAKALVLWGRFDPWLPESDADRFVSAMKHARKVVLAAGHMPQEERPAEVARLIGDFLSP
jgi:pimeloyl-ACP methyl ester carboxylesterase